MLFGFGVPHGILVRELVGLPPNVKTLFGSLHLQGMGDFLTEMVAMMDQTKPNVSPFSFSFNIYKISTTNLKKKNTNKRKNIYIPLDVTKIGVGWAMFSLTERKKKKKKVVYYDSLKDILTYF